jgi:pyruvate-formate lyase-activating enzyme
MNGVIPPECHRCDVSTGAIKNVNLFKDFWNKYYGQYYYDAMSQTSTDGSTSFEPVYYDYRFGNVCNYKCRHCSSASSSSIQLEERQNNLPNGFNLANIDNKDERNNILYSELTEAADSGRLKAVQWIGGEPLFSQYHWDFMNYLHEIKYYNVSVSYITNLSIVQFKGQKLIDILEPFDGVSIHASSESGGLAAEYIRRGMNWNTWTERILEFQERFFKEQQKFRSITPGLTINTFTLCGLEEWIKFIADNGVPVCDITIVKPNHNNLYLGLEYLGSYKSIWVEHYKTIVYNYKDRLHESTYNDLMSAGDLIEQLPLSNDLEHRMARSLHYANTLDRLDGYPTSVDVIKGWTFLEEWWKQLNEQSAK